MTEHRVQLSRGKGWRMPAGAVSVARPHRWGNPYRVGSLVQIGGLGADGLWFEHGGIPLTLDQSIALYRHEVVARVRYRPDLDAAAKDVEYVRGWRGELYRLAGHDLACWCPLAQPCHADVLLELANSTAFWESLADLPRNGPSLIC
jgi:hypothetical protein